MKNTVWLIVVSSVSMHAMQNQAQASIAIDCTSEQQCTQNKSDGITQLLVPVVLYRDTQKVCTMFLPASSLKKADDGSTVYDTSDGSGNAYVYTCNQRLLWTQAGLKPLSFSEALQAKITEYADKQVY